MIVRRTTSRALLKTLDKLNKLSRNRRKFFAIVASRRGGIVSRDTIVEEMYCDREDGGPLTAHRILDVMAYELRLIGLNVRTHYGRGFSYRADWVAKPASRGKAA